MSVNAGQVHGVAKTSHASRTIDIRVAVQWPRLAWVVCVDGPHIQATVGRDVECGDNWLCEAAWTGAFEAHDFDQHDVVFGSGVRVYDDRIVFVSPCHPLERIAHMTLPTGAVYVSNSIPALLAATDTHVDPRYDYAAAIETYIQVDREPITEMPTKEGLKFHVVRCDNLVFNGCLQLEPKPYQHQDFSTYEKFYAHLCRTMDAIGVNMHSPARRRPIRPVTTMSSGYDSPAITVLAKRVGCQTGWTVTQGWSLFATNTDDSGREIAKLLGVELQEVDRRKSCNGLEPWIWASTGRSNDLNVVRFDYPDDVMLLFSGNHAGILWTHARHSPAMLQRSDSGGTGMSEFRLEKGFIQCPFAFVGVQQAKDIEAISFQDAMKPWMLDRKRYNRPLSRRIVEEAGVPRHLFGMTKKAIADWVIFWPTDPEPRRELQRYLKEHGFQIPITWGPFQRSIDRFKATVHAVSKKFLGFSPVQKNYYNLPQNGHFCWSVEKLRTRYAAGLKSTTEPRESSM